MRFNEMMAGVRADIAVKIYGDDFKELERLATRSPRPAAANSRRQATWSSTPWRAPLLEIKPDRDALRRYNLQAEDVNRAVATALAGQEVGTVIEGNRRFPIVVRLAEDARAQRGRDEAPAGAHRRGRIAHARPGRQVSRWSNRSAPITREAGQRRAAILVNLRGRDMEGFVKEAQARIQGRSEVPARLLLSSSAGSSRTCRRRARGWRSSCRWRWCSSSC